MRGQDAAAAQTPRIPRPPQAHSDAAETCSGGQAAFPRCRMRRKEPLTSLVLPCGEALRGKKERKEKRGISVYHTRPRGARRAQRCPAHAVLAGPLVAPATPRLLNTLTAPAQGCANTGLQHDRMSQRHPGRIPEQTAPSAAAALDAQHPHRAAGTDPGAGLLLFSIHRVLKAKRPSSNQPRGEGTE